LLIGQAAQRLKPDLIMMEMMGIRKMANRAMIMTRQFFSEPKAIELIASQDELKKASLTKIYTMTPEELIGKVNFHSTGLSESLDKSQNIDKLLKYAEVTAKIPAMQAITNYENIGKRIGLWLGFEDIDDFILLNPQDPYQPVQPPAPIPTPGPALPGVPGVPGFPPGVPPPGPLPGAPAAVPVGVTNQANPGQGLPPELLQLIVQSIISGQG